jgi:hypothetical protein
MSEKSAEEALHQHWVHSYEEDTPAEMVFRPAGFPFPPARGRRGFELKPDGTLVRYAIGPTDRREASAGRWQLTADNRLLFYPDAAAEADRVLQVASVEPDRLVVRK